MEIIKNGKNVVTHECANCGCVFRYNKKTETKRNYIPSMGGGNDWKDEFILCPECGKRIALKTNKNFKPYKPPIFV